MLPSSSNCSSCDESALLTTPAWDIIPVDEGGIHEWFMGGLLRGLSFSTGVIIATQLVGASARREKEGIVVLAAQRVVTNLARAGIQHAVLSSVSIPRVTLIHYTHHPYMIAWSWFCDHFFPLDNHDPH